MSSNSVHFINLKKEKTKILIVDGMYDNLHVLTWISWQNDNGMKLLWNHRKCNYMPGTLGEKFKGDTIALQERR